jgi:hypothetical protein
MRSAGEKESMVVAFLTLRGVSSSAPISDERFCRRRKTQASRRNAEGGVSFRACTACCFLCDRDRIRSVVICGLSEPQRGCDSQHNSQNSVQL